MSRLSPSPAALPLETPAAIGGDSLSGALEVVSGLSSYVILGAFALHLGLFFILWLWYRGSLKRMASALDDFTRSLRHRSVLDSTSHLSDQIESFLADVHEVLQLPPSSSDRQLLAQRIRILDEKRRFANSLKFETTANFARTMVEAYPLAGILGTILAIGAALQTPDAGGSADAAESANALSLIVGSFGDAIWSTFAGLTAAIVLMFVNSILEPAFARLHENREHARDTVAAAKRELGLTGTAVASGGPPAAAVPPYGSYPGVGQPAGASPEAQG